MNSIVRAKTQNSRLIDIYGQNNVPVVDTVPRRIQIIPTLRCNYRCTMCFQSEESHQLEEEIDFSIYEQLEDVFPFVQSVYFTGGEPLMYSEMPRALEYLAKFGISTSMSTNGSLLTGKRLECAFKYMDTVKISLDAATPDTYAAIRRNGDFSKVVHNITNLLKMKIQNYKKSPNINFSMVAMKSNIAELPDLVSLIHTLGSRELRVAHAAMQRTQVEMPEESLYFHKEESDHYMIEAIKRARSLGVNLVLPSLFNVGQERGGSYANADF
ncbi:radical SAM protein [Pseudodesulfovibrio sp.]|uniref:radical SAM protein n=1 Tax=unclassified Pseudodesulfovibrio TaxID=2661612 RepID=UPI003AFF6193